LLLLGVTVASFASAAPASIVRIAYAGAAYSFSPPHAWLGLFAKTLQE